jgi:hypothetical protein
MVDHGNSSSMRLVRRITPFSLAIASESSADGRSPIPGIVLGTAGLAFSSWMFVNAKIDLKAYASDRYRNVAQYFRTAVVAIETRSVLADTDAMPEERLSRWAFFGIVARAAGCISALVALWRA